MFTSLLRDPGQFAGRSSPMTFLYRMTTNAALGRIRRRRAQGQLLSAHPSECEPPASAGPETLVELRAWLSSLPDELAQVAIYYHLDDMTQQEIADVLGCSRQWVGKLLLQLKAHQRRRVGT